MGFLELQVLLIEIPSYLSLGIGVYVGLFLQSDHTFVHHCLHCRRFCQVHQFHQLLILPLLLSLWHKRLCYLNLNLHFLDDRCDWSSHITASVFSSVKCLFIAVFFFPHVVVHFQMEPFLNTTDIFSPLAAGLNEEKSLLCCQDVFCLFLWWAFLLVSLIKSFSTKIIEVISCWTPTLGTGGQIKWTWPGTCNSVSAPCCKSTSPWSCGPVSLPLLVLLHSAVTLGWSYSWRRLWKA